MTKIDKRELLLLENPRYEKVLSEHPHLRGVHMDDEDEKSQLPVLQRFRQNSHLGTIACWPPRRSCSRIHEIWLGADVTWSRDRSFIGVPCRQLNCRLRALMLARRPWSSGHSNWRSGRFSTTSLRNNYRVLQKDGTKPHCPGKQIIRLSLTTMMQVAPNRHAIRV